MPTPVIQFLDRHPDALVSVLRGVALRQVVPADFDAAFSDVAEGADLRNEGRDAHVAMLQAVRGARTDGPTTIELETTEATRLISAMVSEDGDAIILVVHPDAGLAPLRPVEERTTTPAHRLVCDERLMVLSADASFADVLGLDVADLTRMSVLDLMIGESADSFIDCWLESTRHSLSTTRVRMLTADRSERWFQTTASTQYHASEIVFVDVTDDVMAARLVEQRERNIRNIAETVPFGIFRCTLAGTLLFKNSNLDAVYGGPVPAVMPIHKARLLDGTPLPESLAGIIEDGEATVDVRHPTGAGERFVRLRVRTYTNSQGHVELIGSAEDITASIKRQEQLQVEAVTDPLTGAANRRGLEMALEELLAPGETHRTFGVLMCDLDGFKQVNDSLGHDAGDMVIREVGRRLTALVRGDDFVARLGGDEFVIIAKGVPDYDHAMEFAERVLPALRAPFDIGEGQIELSGSVGVAISTPTSTMLTVLQMADHAMYEAKRAGRNQAMPYVMPDDSATLSPLAMRRDLRRALVSGGLDLAFQPIFPITDDSAAIGAEALLRWNHPTHGQIGPAQIIPVAEQSGLVRDLSDWIVREALQAAADVNRELEDRDIGIGVNLSATQLGQDGFVDTVLAALDYHQLRPELLVFELTETHLVDRVDNARAAVERLHEAGVTLIVDNFGSSQSSFEYLLSMPMTALKIDRTFTARLSEQRAWAMLAGICAGAKSLGLGVIVEGIEDEKHLRLAERAGATHAQGFHLGLPMSTTELARVHRNAA